MQSIRHAKRVDIIGANPRVPPVQSVKIENRTIIITMTKEHKL